LYNLKADIGEENNVAAQNTEQVSRMTNIMSQAHIDHPEFPLTPVTRMLKGKNKSKKNKNK